MPLMRPNWRRCEAATKSGELCMNKAQTMVGGKYLCRTQAKTTAKPA